MDKTQATELAVNMAEQASAPASGLAAAAMKASPAVVVSGGHIAGLQIPDIVGILTILYLVFQIAALLRNEWPKWRKARGVTMQSVTELAKKLIALFTELKAWLPKKRR